MPARCVFSKPFALALHVFSAAFLASNCLTSASCFLHGNIMCVTVMSLSLFYGVIPGTQDRYRFFHFLYMLSKPIIFPSQIFPHMGKTCSKHTHVSTYIYIYIYTPHTTNTHTHTHTHLFIYIYIHHTPQTHTHTYTFIYIYIYIYIHTHTNLYSEYFKGVNC